MSLLNIIPESLATTGLFASLSGKCDWYDQFRPFFGPPSRNVGGGYESRVTMLPELFFKKKSKKIMSIDITLVWYFVFSYIFGVATGMLGLFWIMFFLVEGGSKIIIEKEGP